VKKAALAAFLFIAACHSPSVRAGGAETPSARKPLLAEIALGDAAAARPGAGQRPNRLVRERSPYLREHAFDPVDWRPWGKDAFAEAKRRGVPLFVSSGYSTCHWCHVMHRQSFEDEEVARKLNEGFVCVKVDREELPDVDESLIRAVQAISGNAGWPCTVFLLDDGRPFYGATYFPKNALLELLANITSLWNDPERRKGIAGDARELADFMAKSDATAKGTDLSRQPLRAAVLAFTKRFDKKNGGFGKAPKFPSAPDLSFLLRHSHSETARKMALFTLDRILAGGVHDHVGGGFHRYSTDEEWKVPHFEKTLYDQALLLDALVSAFELTHEERYAQAIRGTCEYVLRDLRLPSGGFASAEDADSSGAEGLFYTWTQAEVASALGDEKLAAYANDRFGVEVTGPVDGRSVLHLAKEGNEKDDALVMDALRRVREGRVRPPRDEKVLAGWNGLMIGALARASWVVGEPRWLDAARTAARLVDTKLVKEGRLQRRLVGDEARFPAALEDHAYLVHAYVELYEADLDPVWLEKARELLAKTKALYWDGEHFRSRASDQEALVAAPGEVVFEGALPSPAAVLALEETRLARLAGKEPELARSQLLSVGGSLAREPDAAPTFLAALDSLLAEPVEVVVSGRPGEATTALLREARSRASSLFASSVVALVDGSDAAKKALGDLAEGREPGEKPRVFLCVGKTCQAPVDDPAKLPELFEKLGK
jgi:uncharacterized protein YyaL (SSP411 family)